MEMDKRISRHLLEEVARGTRWLLEKGFTPSGDSGDVSLRDPVTGLIYISGFLKGIPFPYTDFNDFRAQDMAVFEPDGTKITPWCDATIEAPMHLAIYRARPDVMSVVHSHPLWASMFAIAGEDIPLTLAEQYINLGAEIRTARYAPAGAMEMGDYIVEALGSNNAAMMANHGAVTVGPTMEVAFRYSYFLENIAQKTIFAKLLGNVNTISPDEVLAEKFMEGTRP
ncbi:MAG: class II aldolase/adducin family protein [Clostridia bacterium]|nr:class II aldolase/adducin family protein [Clostridia bacterium]